MLRRREFVAADSELVKETDGYLARYDRRLSLPLSRLLARTRVTPNQITTASLLLGLTGACLLATGVRWTQFSGALVLWVCCILDGCDGEVARLKGLCTPWGAEYDLWADQIGHLATAAAIPFGVHRAFPRGHFAIPGVLLVTGFAACGYFMWRLVLSPPESSLGRHSLFVERIAGRDYVYLLVVLTALGRLDWFLWAAAFGTHAFWLALVWISRGHAAPRLSAARISRRPCTERISPAAPPETAMRSRLGLGISQ